MALFKIVFAAVVLSLLACNGFGLTSIPKIQSAGECHTNIECKSIIPSCVGIPICFEGVCTCGKTTLSITQCRSNPDCATNVCDPPCTFP
ncbi:hypothetical protein CR513_26862, partial [Mucuna pruriens]